MWNRLIDWALEVTEVGDPTPVEDATVLFKNEDGTWSVCDNGEEVVCENEQQVRRIITENLS